MLIIAGVNIMHGNVGTRSVQLRKFIQYSLFYATVCLAERERRESEEDRERKERK